MARPRTSPQPEVPGLAARRIAADILDGVLRRKIALDEQLSGKTSNNNTVNFAGPAYLIGRLVDVRITADAGSSLRGELAPEGQAAAANWT